MRDRRTSGGEAAGKSKRRLDGLCGALNFGYSDEESTRHDE